MNLMQHEFNPFYNYVPSFNRLSTLGKQKSSIHHLHWETNMFWRTLFFEYNSAAFYKVMSPIRIARFHTNRNSSDDSTKWLYRINLDSGLSQLINYNLQLKLNKSFKPLFYLTMVIPVPLELLISFILLGKFASSSLKTKTSLVSLLQEEWWSYGVVAASGSERMQTDILHQSFAQFGMEEM